MPLGDTLNPLVSDPIRVRIDIFRGRLAGPDSANEVANLAYAFFVKLFEAGGEHNIRPNGSPVLICNGHHAAQKMAKMVRLEWESHLNPPEEGEVTPDMADPFAADSGAPGAVQ